MDCFKSILYLLGVLRHPVPKPLRASLVALELSEPSKLPPELILHITRFLSPESTLAFSLCCQPIYFMFGTQRFQTVAQNSHCYEFLALLARGLTNHVPCYYCKKLHAIEKAQQHISSAYRSSATWLPCWKANYNFTFSHLHNDFSFTVFQMAMKRYRQGLNYHELLNLLSCKETYHRDGYVEHYSALARIVDGSMLIREQKIVIVSLAQPSLIQETQRITVCSHISLIWNLESQGLHGIVERVQSLRWNVPIIDCNWQGLVRWCNYCLTDFCLDFKQYEEKVEAIFVTKWQDLGQGRSPLDLKWQSHVARSADRLWLSVEFDHGSVCTSFERKEHFRFESNSLLTQQDKKGLFGLLERT